MNLELIYVYRLVASSLAGTTVIWSMIKRHKKSRALPPGPCGVPFLGCLPWMNKGAPHHWYLSLAARYGDIFSLKLGSNLVVCISSPKLLREFFNRFDSTGRPRTPLNNLLGGYGIVLSEGELWKRQRQFLHDKFRALGVKLWTYQRFEKYIIAEIEEMILVIDNKNGQSLDPVIVLGRHIHNVICQLMMSFRFEEDDRKFTSFNELISRGMKLFGSIHIGEYLSFYMKLPGKKAVLKEISNNLKNISKFHEEHLIKRVEERSRSSTHHEPEDLLDFYIQQMHKDTDDGEMQSVLKDKDKVRQVVQVMNDLFSAGMETSRTAIVWIIIIMLREPEVANRVRTELAEVAGTGQLITLEHRLQLPYLEAVIFETLRRTSVVPLGTSHMNTAQWKINEYIIPPGTTIVPLINKINMDPRYFPEPTKFIPERFLLNGKAHIPEYFIPFGVGRRVCLGDQLARMELFLFFANLMNHYDFMLPEGDEMPALEGSFGTIHAPHPYRIIFKKIQN
ncbi:unnamed protein product [Leptosia nina]|uniref:Cytochrome P450 n=1 Tax=Leptosia nina TaxID=320188 RepID=A0AAV1JV16_9NEOP